MNEKNEERGRMGWTNAETARYISEEMGSPEFKKRLDRSAEQVREVGRTTRETLESLKASALAMGSAADHESRIRAANDSIDLRGARIVALEAQVIRLEAVIEEARKHNSQFEVWMTHEARDLDAILSRAPRDPS